MSPLLKRGKGLPRPYWAKGHRVSHVEDTRTIVIGGESFEEKEKNKKKKEHFNQIISSKYTTFTFLPINLFEQFRRIANFYFLVISLIALIIDSPVPPLTSIAPLVFVVTVTGAKQGYEDYLRHKSDRAVNRALVTVMRCTVFQEIKCENIQRGDIVRVGRDCDVPCDLVLLASSDPAGRCHVTTANLDGETNLKTLTIPRGLREIDPVHFDGMGKIECQEPITDLYSFFGRIEINMDTQEGHAIPLGPENLLLRGSRVKNTEWIIGCAVYTGIDTKLALNSKITNSKFSSTEKSINKYLFFFMFLLIFYIMVCFFMKRYYDLYVQGHDDYFGVEEITNPVASALTDLFSFLMLFNYLIPISLYVTVEMHKFFGALFLEWDLQLYCPVMQQCPIVNTSDLNEELGQIEVLFSDKTGTLTKNEMYLKRCSVNGIAYIEKEGELYMLDHRGNEIEDQQKLTLPYFTPELKQFFKALALCHTVQIAASKNPNKKPIVRSCHVERAHDSRSELLTTDTTDNYIGPIEHEIIYEASSPDEKALIEGCSRIGIQYIGDDLEILQIKTISKYRRESNSSQDTSVIDNVDFENNNDILEEYTRLDVLEFTSERRRMSVIVKDKNDQIWLYCKGAESAILSLCTPTENSVTDATNRHVNDFARLGLRTLAVAAKKLSLAEYEEYQKSVNAAKTSLSRRSTLLVNSYRTIEQGMTLLGATAVEDALQDDVRDTLISLREAGIKIWILTGDKVETAVNVANACGHIAPDSLQYYLTDLTTDEACLELLKQFGTEVSMRKNDDKFITLVVDGSTLARIMKCASAMFADVAIQCHAVLCCRLSPLQKCEVVHLIKHGHGKPITAAIGDGANDVSMIQEAHLGLGIIGKEGTQAARCADFAFANFSMIKRMFLVHGHWYYQRLATLVQFFFYKNLVLMNVALFFQFICMFSALSVYDSLFLTTYNVVLTSFPILLLSLTEQIYDERTLIDNPQLYMKNHRNRLLDWRHFMGWCFLATYHSAVIYASVFFVIHGNPAILLNSAAADFCTFGTFLFHCVVIVVNIKLWMFSHRQSYWFIFTIVMSILLFMVMTVVYSLINFGYDGDMLGVYIQILQSPVCWILTIFVVITCLIPDFVRKVYKALHIRRWTAEDMKDSIPLPIRLRQTDGVAPETTPKPVTNNVDVEVTRV